jgi:hypothetical protein
MAKIDFSLLAGKDRISAFILSVHVAREIANRRSHGYIANV